MYPQGNLGDTEGKYIGREEGNALLSSAVS